MVKTVSCYLRFWDPFFFLARVHYILPYFIFLIIYICVWCFEVHYIYSPTEKNSKITITSIINVMATANNSTDDSSLEVMKSWMSQNIACISESASVQDAGDRAAEMKENWVEWINGLTIPNEAPHLVHN